MMKRETLRAKRSVVFKMDYRGPDANTYAQVLDSHLEALDEIDRLRANRCPGCGHAIHKQECWNMASDGECDCQERAK